MNPTGLLHRAGQSLWLDNITRDLLTSGTLERYARDLAVTGLTSNPTIYDRAIGGTSAYDEAIRAAAARGASAEETFFELALDDLRNAADMFRPVFDRTGGVDGYVSLEVSPVLAHDTGGDRPRGGAAACARRPPQPLHQDPGHAGGPAGDRGLDLRRRAGERDAPVLPAAVPRLRGGVHAGHRAAHRGRPAGGSGLGRVGLHQPLGPGGRGIGAGRAAEQAGHRDRPAGVRRVPALLRHRPLGPAAERRGSPPAAPVREHRDQGPRRVRTSSTSRGWRLRTP